MTNGSPNEAALRARIQRLESAIDRYLDFRKGRRKKSSAKDGFKVEHTYGDNALVVDEELAEERRIERIRNE